MSNRALVTHHDLDGIGSIILSIVLHIDFNQVYISNYSRMTRSFAERLGRDFDEVIVTDISFGEFIQPNMREFDHHGIHDEGRCGTWLFYYNYIPNELHTGRLDSFVRSVDAYDTWKRDDHEWFEKGKWWNYLFIQLTNGLHRTNYNLNLSHIEGSPWRRVIEVFTRMMNPDFEQLTPQLNAMIENMRHILGDEYRRIRNTYQVREVRGIRFIDFRLASQINDIDNSMLMSVIREQLDLNVVILRFRGPKASLRSSADFNLNQIPSFTGHAHAGVALQEEIDRFFRE